MNEDLSDGEVPVPPRPVVISGPELQALEDFNGYPGTQDARRWWMKLENLMRSTDRPEKGLLPERLVRLFDMKMCGDAAQWADITPEVSEILLKERPVQGDVGDLKKLFISRFRTVTPTIRNVNKDLQDLQQGPGEALEDYYARARRILLRVCEDSVVDGVPRSTTRAEAQWVNTVVNQFIKGLSERWVEYHVEEGEPSSLDRAYMLAIDNTRKLKKFMAKTTEWEKAGYTPPPYGLTSGLPGGFMPLPIQAVPSPGAARGYASDPQDKGNTRPNPQAAGPGPPLKGYTSDPSPRDIQQQRAGPAPAPVPFGQQWPRNPPPPHPPRLGRGDLKTSSNPFVNGSQVYRPDHRNPLCVACGALGHVSKWCRASPLLSWEREQLRALVFPDTYQNSRLARLHKAGIESNEREIQEEDWKLYHQAGYVTAAVAPGSSPEEVGSRLSQLDLGDESDHLISSRGAHGDPGPSAPTKYKTVRIQDILDKAPPPPVAGTKRDAKSDLSERDRAPSKKERLAETTPHAPPLLRPIRVPKGVSGTKVPRKPRKRVADLTEAEKAERLIKKNQRKQLKMIKGMTGYNRFDLAKALAETPCPISYLQYFQDSPIARQEMSRITSLTTEVLAGMFGDPIPVREPSARSGLVNEREGQGETPHMGSGGAFMVDATITGIHSGSGSFRTSKVCVDAGSEIDIATPATIQKVGGEIILMEDTPWPTMSVRTSSGDSTKLLGIARINVRIHGNERVVYTCVIPPKFAANTGYDLLLGVPWLYDVRGKISVRDGTISIHNGQEEVVISTGKFTPPNLRVMFEGIAPRHLPNSKLPSDQDRSESDTSDDPSDPEDSGEESVKSSDTAEDTWKEQGKYKYPSIVAPYSRTSTVYARSTTLVIERPDPASSQGPGEVARIRYITPEDYLLLYGEEGPFSHLAKVVKGVDIGLQSDEGEPTDKGNIMMIIDSENRAGALQNTNEVVERLGEQDFLKGVIPEN